jgi:predicted nucleic acid-binding protein
MRTKRKTPIPPAITAFWDASALVPLCCFQSQTSGARYAARTYATKVTWWSTPVEMVSAFNRLAREGLLTPEGKQQAITRLAYLRRTWSEVHPTDELRDIAERLLNVHKLRAADGLQLSAALVWCSHLPRSRHFIAADGTLAAAAAAEGFTVIRM